MALDPNIILNAQQLKVPDVLGMADQGMRLSQLARQNRMQDQAQAEKMALRDAYSRNLVTNPDGTKSLNLKSLAGDAYGIDPEKGYAIEQAAKTQPIDDMKNKLSFINSENEVSRSILSKIPMDKNTPLAIKEQAWQNGLLAAKKAGISDADEFAKTYASYPGDEHAKSLLANLYDEKTKLDQHWKELNYGQKERFQNQDTETARMKIAAEIKKERMQAKNDLYIPGVGYAINADDAKQLKEATVNKKDLDEQLSELIALRKNKGVEYLDRDAVARAKQLSNKILLNYKNMAKLGVLSKSDEDIINSIVPADPLGQDWAPGQDPILTKLEAFKNDIGKDYENTLKARLKYRDAEAPQTPKAGQEQSQQISAPDGATKVWNGVTYKVMNGNWVAQ